MNKNDKVFNNKIYICKIKDLLIKEGIIPLNSDIEFHVFSYKDEHNICYIVKTRNKNLFLKLTNKKTDSDMVDSVTRYLFEKKLNVIPSIKSGLKININSMELKLDISHYLNSRGYNYSYQDFVSFLNVIEPVHSALANFPQKEQIKQKSVVFTNNLNQTRDTLLLSLKKKSFEDFGVFTGWIKQNEKFISTIIQKMNIKMDNFFDSQCVHGDLHMDNVLFDNKGTPFIIDFDEGTKVFAPVSYDIAYIFFRFCILPETAGRFDQFTLPEKLNTNFKIIKKVYQKRIIPMEKMFDLIQTISVKLILIVFFNFLEYGLVFPLSELEKFKAHYLLIEKIKSI